MFSVILWITTAGTLLPHRQEAGAGAPSCPRAAPVHQPFLPRLLFLLECLEFHLPSDPCCVSASDAVLHVTVIPNKSQKPLFTEAFPLRSPHSYTSLSPPYGASSPDRPPTISRHLLRAPSFPHGSVLLSRSEEHVLPVGLWIRTMPPTAARVTQRADGQALIHKTGILNIPGLLLGGMI